MIHAYQGMHIHMFSASQPTTPNLHLLMPERWQILPKIKIKIVTGITMSLFILERLLGHITWQSEVFLHNSFQHSTSNEPPTPRL